ncbi:MAG: SMC-Scp complex subunit ScpB, partial [Planctomycetales bacterium]|nr:SMC-Scp complex subunit ScpB [Planctomycetales bacterium]
MRGARFSTPRVLGGATSRFLHPLAAASRGLSTSTRLVTIAWPAADTAPPENLEFDADGNEHRRARVEAVLLVAREPLTSRKLAQLANLADGTEARTLVRQLNNVLTADRSAYRVEEVAGGYQLLTRPEFARWLRQLQQRPDETRLSAPALETLSVVAYRQPALRAEVEAIRGVQCGEMLRQLMERDMVRIVGRSDELGRPFLYGTTKRFLQVFGLRHLDELPRAEVLRGRGTIADDTEETITEEAMNLGVDQKESDVNVARFVPSDDPAELVATLAPPADELVAVDEDYDDEYEDEEEDDDEDDDEYEDEEDDEEYDDDEEYEDEEE